MSDVTLITVTHNTWESYTQHLIANVFQSVDPELYEDWLIVDNNSGDADKVAGVMSRFPKEHRNKISLIRSDKNITDLPTYNRVIPTFVRTKKIICISTDMRLFPGAVETLINALDKFDIAGNGGIDITKGQADPIRGGEWHWVAKLLVDRGIDFDRTTHVQTHCCGIKRDPFVEVGGFWEPESGPSMDKGDLICGEVVLSYRLRIAGYKIGRGLFPAYHFGNSMKTLEEIEQFEGNLRWEEIPRLETFLS